MAVGIVQALTAALDFSSSATDTIAFSAPITPGNLVVIWLGLRSDPGVNGIQDDGANSYSLAVEQDVTLDNQHAQIRFFKPAGAIQTLTVTLASAEAGAARAKIWEISGSAASPLDDTSSAETDGVTTHDTGSVTTTEASAIVIGGSAGGFEDYTADGDFTDTFADNNFALGHLILSSTATLSWTTTSGGNSQCANVIAAFKASAGAAERRWLFGARQ